MCAKMLFLILHLRHLVGESCRQKKGILLITVPTFFLILSCRQLLPYKSPFFFVVLKIHFFINLASAPLFPVCVCVLLRLFPSLLLWCCCFFFFLTASLPIFAGLSRQDISFFLYCFYVLVPNQDNTQLSVLRTCFFFLLSLFLCLLKARVSLHFIRVFSHAKRGL